MKKSPHDLKKMLGNLLMEQWNSESLKFVDSERTRRLRPEILRRLLSLVMTDDERATDLGLASGCRVRESAKIINPENLRTGQGVWIGENAIVDASGGLDIGANVTIGTGVFVWTHTSVLSSLLGQNEPGNQWIRRAPTYIGQNTFIGGPSVINPGVVIGEGCLILPMSVVTTDVPSNTMVGGAPAVFRRTIDEAWIAREREKFESV